MDTGGIMPSTRRAAARGSRWVRVTFRGRSLAFIMATPSGRTTESSQRPQSTFHAVLQPTTNTQVSGYKFLLRRAEHGAVMGDIRMINDPLGARKKALAFGAAAALIVGVGAVGMAFFRPQIDPGEAAIVVAESGALYVRADDGLHPVPNLASARLVAGEAAEPAKISDAVLAKQRFAPELGIPVAPATMAAEAPEVSIVACHDPRRGEITVGPGVDYRPLSESEAFVVRDEHNVEWLITRAGRRVLPPVHDSLGAATRAVVGIDTSTLVAQTSSAWLNTVSELPEFRMPAQPWDIADVGESSYLVRREGLIRLSATQREILIQLGAQPREATREDISGYADSPDTLNLLDRAFKVRDVPVLGGAKDQPYAICSGGDQRVPGIRQTPIQDAIPLTHSVANFYAPHRSAGLAFAVDTSRGLHVISESGRRHPVPSSRELAVLGVKSTTAGSWPVLALLPQGQALSSDNAHRVVTASAPN